ncbi:MAG: hypothetical protein E6G13_14275 [Actinobacteria bacterium]|nr:MAG: hypothetical protein E6G13_14275 [Actinomycetota bacterium]
MRPTFRNPVITGAAGEDHGDPFIIKYLDAFYLYHTGDTAGRRGVSVHRSADLVHWEFAGYALEAAESGWAWSDLWAPEVVYERGVFYMYISATRRRTHGEAVKWQRGEGAEAGRRVGVARATHPLGPFVWDEHPLLDCWSIDAHPFRDDDGTMWLFYNVRTEDDPTWDGLAGTGTVVERLVDADRVAGRPRIASRCTAAATSRRTSTQSAAPARAASPVRGRSGTTTPSSVDAEPSAAPATTASSSAPMRRRRTSSITATSATPPAARCSSTG